MPRSMQEVHALGQHKKIPRKKCPECHAARVAQRERGLSALAQREAAVKRLHAFSCPVPMWEMIGRHHCRPRPACSCGAENPR